MIKVMDLIRWAKANAVGSSVTEPAGWIRGKDLQQLAEDVVTHEPFAFAPKQKKNTGEDEINVTDSM